MLDRLVLFPRHMVPRVKRPDPLPWERLTIPLERGKVEAWLILGQGVSASAPGPLVLFAHGNGELIDYWPDTLAPYRERGISVLLPEYRGYGHSDGSPSQPDIGADMVLFLEQALARLEVDSTRVVYHGRSLGGGVVCDLARHRAPRALVLESTFKSIPDVARRFRAPRWVVRDHFESAKVVPNLECPVLVFHGRQDGLVPHSHGEELARLAPRGRLVSYDCSHNDLPREKEGFWREVWVCLSEAGVL